MSALNEAAHVAETVYGMHVDGIDILQGIASTRRGVFKVSGRIHRAETQGVLRLSREDGAVRDFAGTAHVIQFLEQHQYQAPRLIRTADNQSVGQYDEWHALFATYLPGHSVLPNEHTVFEMARRLGELHRIPPTFPQITLPDSRWNITHLPDLALRYLTQANIPIPHENQSLHQALCEACQRVTRHAHLPTGIVHGDAWHMNAIDGKSGIAFIDWDWSGIGQCAFDLAMLLVTCHYDLSRPEYIEPNPRLIHSALMGYQAVRQITDDESAALPDIMPFYLAYQFSRYYAGGISIYEDEALLRKWQRRFEATFEIAEIASGLL